MLLAELVATSQRVRATRSRNAKVAAIAEVLARCAGEEVATAVAYLSGDAGLVLGVGPRAVYALSDVPAAAEASLTLAGVRSAFAAIAAGSGSGSAGRRKQLLVELFAGATEDERRFLAGLITGELRQGALEGLMIEAVASAAKVPAESVRRAAMLGGELASVAARAVVGGASALEGFDVLPLRPVRP